MTVKARFRPWLSDKADFGRGFEIKFCSGFQINDRKWGSAPATAVAADERQSSAEPDTHSYNAVERIRHIQDSQGKIPAVALK